eukprot:TRINITY_DN4426_c0_g1_i3.p1 TRINITY_DN4426_c0_g1~~TRINITY_DN4426_c0_g1_i3.p1  ORF type:complete len:340 (-),score=110.95 TRINITY_DN4426_c0_g1_i3:188-1207(-)
MTKIVLCIDYGTNWTPQFAKRTLSNGEKIQIEQAEWKDISIVSSTQNGLVVHLKAMDNPWPFTNTKEERTLNHVDLVLVRNFPTDLHNNDFKSIVMGFMVAGIPCVNSFHSIFMSMNRVVLQGELKRATDVARRRMESEGHKNPPVSVVPMTYFPNKSHLENSLTLPGRRDREFNYPSVIKVGNTHAGYGKMRVTNKSDHLDLSSILALNNDYYTVEPLVSYQFEYRIQKIGNNIRCFRRNNTNRENVDKNEWKNNWGNLAFEDHPTEEFHRIWIEECSKIFGGMDICALDVLHSETEGEIALELNDTACGLMFQHEQEDIGHIRDLLIERLESQIKSN